MINYIIFSNVIITFFSIKFEILFQEQLNTSQINCEKFEIYISEQLNTSRTTMDTFLFKNIPMELEQQIAQTVLAKRTMTECIMELTLAGEFARNITASPREADDPRHNVLEEMISNLDIVCKNGFWNFGVMWEELFEGDFERLYPDMY